MKAIGEFFKTGLGITLAIIVSLGILAVIGYNFWGWFGGSDKWKSDHPDNAESSGDTGSIPNSFYSRECGGMAPIMKIKWYKENGKYYTKSEPLPNNPNPHTSVVNEISEQTSFFPR